MGEPSAKVRRDRARKLLPKLKRIQGNLWGKPKERIGKTITALRKERKRANRELAAKHGPAKAVAWAVQQIGTTEQPANSNWGPKIQDWIKFTGYTSPVPWCGCFVAYASVKVAGALIPNRLRLGYVPYIVADANSRSNGLVAVSDPKPGDFACFDFDGGVADHVGLVESVTASTVTCIEGNTSPGTSGSQANGGGVFRRTRPRNQVVCFARPTYR